MCFKKGVGAPGLTGTSIFETPDNPHGRGKLLMSDVCIAVDLLF
jgi:hypothetical protein